MNQTILIVADKRDFHAAAVSEALKKRGEKVEWIDFTDLTESCHMSMSIEQQPDAKIISSPGHPIELSEVKTIWWRRPKSPQENSELDEDTRNFVHGEWEHFLESFEAFVPGVKWVNRPYANRIANRKGFQLTAAKEAGLRIPNTLMTNDPSAVRSLADRGNPLVYKRIGGAPRPITATKELLPSDLNRLDSLTQCPAIFQERIEASMDIRVTAIGHDLYAAEIDSQSGSSQLDWRFDHSVPFRPHLLDKETSQSIRKVMEKLGILYGAFDLRLTPEGEYVFLEVNPSGQFLFIELLTEIPLTEHMAAFLSLSK
ncbi:Glutathione synthase/RimK-type ligase, ATP-grasp superfamily [Halobacillus alkaliphilus]|uniref:Glutathione synthase/RimK-type ligase, ATP-grasp superfamily n=1 Tax=Halobacillus alkaliphilus TaxID=396056 RepID=A0A1I2PH10_9BACI|nr:hypothetical protein [Halobacillus alkaliphilus]SFG15455.1 Glutathione synthase/RimK-type ligase, ATP-grasp superfamily [Halobacillus alkaliphilus]